MKNIYFITGTIDETKLEGSGGVAKVIIQVANALSTKRDLNCFIYSSFAGDNKPHYLLSDNVKLVYAQKIFRHRPDLKLLRKGLFWIVAVYFYIKYFLPRIRGSDSPLIITCTPAATIFFLFLSYFFNLKVLVWENVTFTSYKNIIGYVRKKLFPKATTIISSTEYDYNFYMNFGCKAFYIPNPVVVDRVKNLKDSSSTPEVVILAAGRLVPQKGFDTLLDIAAILKKRFLNWKIIIVGNGPDESSLKDKCLTMDLSDFVEFHPFTTHLENFYRMASIFVLPSRYEGSPLVLIEAQSLGIPCVAFDCPTGPREIIVQNESGFLIEPDNIEEFSIALAKLLVSSDLRTLMGTKAKIAADKFSLDSVIKKWLFLLDNI